MQELATLITGANGEIGHGLIVALKEKNPKNIVVMDLNKIDDSISRYCNEEIIGDILDLDLINKLNNDYEFETIYHLAALLSTRSELSPQSAHDVNVGGTMNLLNLAYKQGLSQGTQIKFFFPSSIAVYGLKNIKEKILAGAIKENSYKNPFTIYGCNKLYCEHLGNYYANYYQRLSTEKYKSHIDFRSIRFPGIISSDTIPSAGTSDYIPDMLHAVGKGEPYNCFVRENTKIPFMTMPDAIGAIMQIMSVPQNNLNHFVYNIRSFAPTAEEFQKELITFFPEAEIKYEVNEKKQKMIDSWPEDTNDNAAKLDWNWQPQHSLESGLKDYLIPGVRKKYK